MIAQKAENGRGGAGSGRAIRRRRTVPPQSRTLRPPGTFYVDESEMEVVLNPVSSWKSPDSAPLVTPPTVSTPGESDPENLELKALLLAQLDTIQRQSEDICRKDRQLRELQRENGDLKRRLKDMEWARKAALNAEQESRPSWKMAQFSPPILETEELYYCSAGEAFVAREREEIAHIRAHAEVPAWRARLLSPTRSGGAVPGENLSDAHFLKRHAKLEADEKRRKRWDIQRIREQVTIQRLKARYEQPDYLFKPGSSSSTTRKPPDPPTERETIYPDPENITHVCVQSTIPVCAFGLPLPKLPPQEFSIPWLSPQRDWDDRSSEGDQSEAVAS